MSTLTKIMRKPITSAIVAIFVGLLVASIILVVAGYDPISSFEALIGGMVGKPKYISNVIIKATPLLFTGIAVAFAFRVGLFNIGAEGQYIVGTILAVIVGFFSTCRLTFLPTISVASSVSDVLETSTVLMYLPRRIMVHSSAEDIISLSL